MTYNPDVHHRCSIRLKDYDYSSDGAYFVTICVQGRECLFGRIVNGDMELNEAGRMVENVWLSLPGRISNIATDEFVVMPNHFHAIVVINNEIEPVGAIHELPLHANWHKRHNEIIMQKHRRNMLLPKIIGYFKMNTAKSINILRGMQGVSLWQRNYYERIIRDEAELDAIRKYVLENPMNWAEDEENPARKLSRRN